MVTSQALSSSILPFHREAAVSGSLRSALIEVTRNKVYGSIKFVQFQCRRNLYNGRASQRNSALLGRPPARSPAPGSPNRPSNVLGRRRESNAGDRKFPGRAVAGLWILQGVVGGGPGYACRRITIADAFSMSHGCRYVLGPGVEIGDLASDGRSHGHSFPAVGDRAKCDTSCPIAARLARVEGRARRPIGRRRRAGRRSWRTAIRASP